MSAGPSKYLWVSDPRLAQALEAAAILSLKVLDAEAKVTGAEQESADDGARLLEIELVRVRSKAATLRSALMRAEELVRQTRWEALRVRMLRLRGWAQPGPRSAPQQLGLFDGPPTPGPSGAGPASPEASTAVPAGEDLVAHQPEASTAVPAGEDLVVHQPEASTAVPAGEDLVAHQPEASTAVPAGEVQVHQVLEASTAVPAGEDLVQVHEEDLVTVDELLPGFCEECKRTRPGVLFNDRRGCRLCPGCWPVEGLVRGVAA